MLIASEKRKTNIAEYILYMWQMEDLLRAYKFDFESINRQIIDQYKENESKKAEIRNWYKSMIASMLDQKIEKEGHLTYLNGLVQELSELNIKLIQMNEDSTYLLAFNDALPAITEIIKKSNGKIRNEVEACLVGLYAQLTMRLKQQEISEGTQHAIKSFSTFIAHLAHKFKQYEENEIEIE